MSWTQSVASSSKQEDEQELNSEQMMELLQLHAEDVATGGIPITTTDNRTLLYYFFKAECTVSDCRESSLVRDY